MKYIGLAIVLFSWVCNGYAFYMQPVSGKSISTLVLGLALSCSLLFVVITELGIFERKAK